MANKNRGEVEFAVDGEAYVLRLGTNEMCELEDRFGTDIQSVFERLDNPKPKFTDVRAIMAAMMGVKDEKKVGFIIDKIGFEKAGQLLAQAVELAFPEAAADSGEPNPAAK